MEYIILQKQTEGIFAGKTVVFDRFGGYRGHFSDSQLDQLDDFLNRNNMVAYHG